MIASAKLASRSSSSRPPQLLNPLYQAAHRISNRERGASSTRIHLSSLPTALPVGLLSGKVILSYHRFTAARPVLLHRGPRRPRAASTWLSPTGSSVILRPREESSPALNTALASVAPLGHHLSAGDAVQLWFDHPDYELRINISREKRDDASSSETSAPP